jgi:glucose-6-phosphate-specific signal transduction histidine kinase
VGHLAGVLPATVRTRAWRDALGVIAYGVAWVLAYHVSTIYWFLPAGLRFATLWCAPRRLWPWLALAEYAALLEIVLQGEGYRTSLGFLLGVLLPWPVHAALVMLARPPAAERAPDSPGRMARLLTAMLAAVMTTALLLTTMSAVEEGHPLAEPASRALAYAVGDFIAMLMLVPVFLQLSLPGSARLPRLLGELLLWFVPLLLLVLAVPAMRARAASYVGLLALVPMVLMVFRHGWPGGGWALACTSVAVHVLGLGTAPLVPRELMQLFLATVGAVTLMLGAAVTALRQARDAMAQKSEALAAQAAELRALSQRLVRAQDDERRRIAQDLSDEMEQGLAALGTRLGLLARTPLEPSQMAAVDSLRALAQSVHGAMRDVLGHLRPAVLDRHGLERALLEGPLHDLLADAGVRYEHSLRGPVGALDADVGNALFRICQEAALDCVRRARGRRFELVLVATPHGTAIEVALRLCYERGAEAASAAPETAWLPGARDRVLALGGSYDCEADAAGIRHRIGFVAAARLPRA